LGTTWPVVTEAMYLLGFAADAQDELWGLLESGRLSLFGLDAADAPRMRALTRKYRDLPMDLADASLVAVAEHEGISKVVHPRPPRLRRLPPRQGRTLLRHPLTPA
jgi:predicted nucleic acid-binding protein